MSQKRSSSIRTRKLVVSGMLAAIAIVLGVTPLGYIPLGVFKVTIMCLPVIIGAILEGPVVGLIVGLVFGLTSLYQAFAAPTVISPLFYNPLVSILPRVLIGPVTYFVYLGMEKLTRRRAEPLSVGVAAIFGTLTNTVLVLGMIFVLYASRYAELLGISNEAVAATLLGTAVANGIPEAIVAVVLSIAVVLAVRHIKIGKKSAK